MLKKYNVLGSFLFLLATFDKKQMKIHQINKFTRIKVPQSKTESLAVGKQSKLDVKAIY